MSAVELGQRLLRASIASNSLQSDLGFDCVGFPTIYDMNLVFLLLPVDRYCFLGF